MGIPRLPSQMFWMMLQGHGPCDGTSSSQNQLLRRLTTKSMENPKANWWACSSPRYKCNWSIQCFWKTKLEAKTEHQLILMLMVHPNGLAASLYKPNGQRVQEASRKWKMELPFLHNQAPLLLRWRMFEIQWLKPEAEQRMR